MTDPKDVTPEELDAWIRSGLDGTREFPPIVTPPESVETVMSRVDESMKLLDRCPGCDAKVTIIDVHDGLPRTVSVTHAEDCPEFVSD